MKKHIKLLVVLMISVLLLGSLAGCKASKKKVLESEYYKELNTKYKKLKKENKKLKKQIKKKDKPSEDEKRSKKYLDKITRDSIVKLEIGHANDMESSEFVENPVAFKVATSIASRADLTTKYTPKQIKGKLACIYEYILYDEDNAIYEIFVYDGDYVIFSDMPNNVYYCYNASVLGDAFLHYQHGYPNSRLFHRLADSSLVVKNKKKYYEKQTAQRAGIIINEMERMNSSKKKAVKYWKAAAKEQKKKYKKPKSVSYTFYHHGNEMKLVIYDEFFSIKNMDGKVKWYQADAADISRLKGVFQ